MAALILLSTFMASAWARKTAENMSVEDLKNILGKSGVVVLDVRSDRDWKLSKFKIKGAIREDPNDFKSWANKYPKDSFIVLYCA